MKDNHVREYCEAEFENIQVILKELSAVVKTGKKDYSTAELALMGTYLHNIYNGVENILKRVLFSRQIKIKNSPTWHKDLLENSLRAKIINKDLYQKLANYLSFRHFFVHSYVFALDWKELEPLVTGIRGAINEFISEVNRYITQKNGK